MAVGVLVILGGTASVTDTLQQYRLPTESMEPTYSVGDRVMAGRDGFPFGEAARGDACVTGCPGSGVQETHNPGQST